MFEIFRILFFYEFVITGLHNLVETKIMTKKAQKVKWTMNISKFFAFSSTKVHRSKVYSRIILSFSCVNIVKE